MPPRSDLARFDALLDLLVEAALRELAEEDERERSAAEHPQQDTDERTH